MRAARTEWGARTAGRVIGLAAVAGFALSGCVGTGTVHESKVAGTLSKNTAPVLVGQTDRAAVRKLLGEPWVASEYWRFDLYRLKGRDVEVMVVLIPTWVSFEEVSGYVVVEYDASGKVSAFDTGSTHGGSVATLSQSSPNFLIKAGAVGFAVDTSKDTPSLFVSSARRDEYLSTHRPDGQCAVLLGIGLSYYLEGIEIDGGELLPLPGGWYGYPQGRGEFTQVRWIAPLLLTPGTHRLEIPRKRPMTFEATTDISCRAGEVLFAEINVTPSEHKVSKTAEMDGVINLSTNMPEAFRDQPLLVWRDGKWLVPQEPQDGAHQGQ